MEGRWSKVAELTYLAGSIVVASSILKIGKFWNNDILFISSSYIQGYYKK